MARNPKQDENLKKGTPFRTAEEARTNGRKGGKASGRTRRVLKTFKEVAIADLSEDDQKTTLKALRTAMRRGYLPAIEFYLKLIGQHPDQGDQMSNEVRIIDADPEGAEYNA